MNDIRLTYCQFLLTSPFNYTQTYLAEHVEGLSHDKINRVMQQIQVTSTDLWEAVQETIQYNPKGFIAFDDTVLDKNHSFQIALVRKQWSGNEHRTIKGIGVVTCVYVNPELNQFWAIDYRLYNPDEDGKNKLDHVNDMLATIRDRGIPFQTILMDCWYAERELMETIHKLGKIYYTVCKPNRLIAEHRGEHAYQRIDSLEWTEEEEEKGKPIRLNDFSREHKVRLFRVVALPGKTEYVVTNDMAQNSQEETKKRCKLRWKIEEFHREIKQLTGIESCQCRKAILQKNHIGCSMVVWARLKNLAYQTGRTVYEICHSQYDQMLRQLLAQPVVTFA